MDTWVISYEKGHCQQSYTGHFVAYIFISLGIKLLGYDVNISLTLSKEAKQFSKMILTLYTRLISNIWSSSCFAFSTFCMSYIKYFVIHKRFFPISYRLFFIVLLDSLFLLTFIRDDNSHGFLLPLERFIFFKNLEFWNSGFKLDQNPLLAMEMLCFLLILISHNSMRVTGFNA